MTAIEDLQASNNHPFAPLCIKVGFLLMKDAKIYIHFSRRIFDAILPQQDPRDYFDAQQANAIKTLDDTRAGMQQTKCNLSTAEAYCSLRESISEIKSSGLNHPIIKPEVAVMVKAPGAFSYQKTKSVSAICFDNSSFVIKLLIFFLQVYNGLTQNISSTKYQLGKNPQESILESLPNPTKEELLHVSWCCPCLIRYFDGQFSGKVKIIHFTISRTFIGHNNNILDFGIGFLPYLCILQSLGSLEISAFLVRYRCKQSLLFPALDLDSRITEALLVVLSNYHIISIYQSKF